MATPTLPTRQEVVALCDKEGPNKNGFAYDGLIWIKYGRGVTEAEAAAQQFAYQHADRSILRIPQVYDCFSKTTTTYILMENVEGETYFEYKKKHPEKASEKFNAILDAVRHFWTFEIPTETCPGPFKRQIPINRFFSDRGAGQTFQTAADLEEWINNKLIDRGLPDRVKFHSERLVFSHLDLHPANILVPKYGAICIIDWGMSGLYPLVFEEYGLLHQGNSNFAKRLRLILFGGKASPNLRAISLVARFNAQGG